MTALGLAALLTLAAIAAYGVLGGADFGGGVWDFFATGPRAEAQRTTIGDAIGPVWEANHVWVIFALVALFTCFPPAFADIATGVNAPLTFALAGVVLRGAAFVFRNYTADVPRLARTWTIVFGAASIVAPFFYGLAAGGISTGRYAWSSPFAISVGIFAVTLCAQIAAVWLLLETDDAALRADFRRRAIRATFAVWCAGALAAAVALATEPHMADALRGPAAFGAIAVAMVLGIVVMLATARGAAVPARFAVAAEVIAVLAGWYGAQWPALVPGRWSVFDAAAPESMLRAFLIAATCGMLILLPSLALLFRVFKAKPVS